MVIFFDQSYRIKTEYYGKDKELKISKKKVFSHNNILKKKKRTNLS